MSRYDKLFADYMAELREAHDFAQTWWKNLLALAAPGERDPEAAEAMVRPLWPAGPVSHPRVIAVYRTYHLLIEQMNQPIVEAIYAKQDNPLHEEDWGAQAPDGEGVQEPYYILVERAQLIDKSLGEFIAGLLFVPVGTDDEGNPA